MKNRKVMWALLAGSILVGLAIAHLIIGKTSNHMSVNDVKTMISQGVQLGSNKDQVALFLKSKSIEYTYLDGKKVDLSSSSNVLSSDIRTSDLRGIIISIIRGTSRGVFVSGSIQIVFFFNKSDKLINYTVKEIFTGP